MPVFRKDGHTVLFIHVPKAGGSSIERMFGQAGYQVLYRDPHLGPKSMNQVRRCSPQHMHAELLQQTFRMDQFDLTFMVTRNPLARFKSEYGYARRHQGLDVEQRAVDAWAEGAFKDYQRDPFTLDNHLRPQVDFYVPGCAVYRLEDGLEAAVADLNSRLDTPLGDAVPRVLERKKTGGVASGEVVVSPSLQQRVKAFYSEDYATFGYDR